MDILSLIISAEIKFWTLFLFSNWAVEFFWENVVVGVVVVSDDDDAYSEDKEFKLLKIIDSIGIFWISFSSLPLNKSFK